MKCIFCGEEFTLEGIRSTCGSCGESRDCDKVRCPACGQDNPRVKELITMMNDLLKSNE
ncbi:hypothetical protein CUJ83_11215 [Methanocella sp. CWC-04]|uniref:Uncharacterized protein n=1 Tax=Methanooceanicella nereidis TaxID=2052831 RepID=A0AAP2RE24_9EURY|nr:hypothetical protein [Methanocella sp. CWC-04]MCD1295568.1 hypothetical protein [Methanocella sp. CWC-04]